MPISPGYTDRPSWTLPPNDHPAAPPPQRRASPPLPGPDSSLDAAAAPYRSDTVPGETPAYAAEPSGNAGGACPQTFLLPVPWAATSAATSAIRYDQGAVTRIIQHDAATALDRNIPDDVPIYRGDFVEYDPDFDEFYQRRYTGRLADSETVLIARDVLEVSTDLTHYAWWNDEFDDFFNMQVIDLEHSAYVEAQPALADAVVATGKKIIMEDHMRSFLTDVYDRSETFRGLANEARDTGRISKEDKWTIRITVPVEMIGGEAAFGENHRVNEDDRTITVPDVKAPPDGLLLQSLSDGLTFASCTSPGSILHEMMHVLTGRLDPETGLWEDSQDTPATYAAHGVPERGPVEYLAQRVARECGISVPRRLSYLGFEHEGHEELERNISAEARQALEHYVDMQDEYLLCVFPNRHPPAPAWDPTEGNEPWMNHNPLSASGSPASSTEDMDTA